MILESKKEERKDIHFRLNTCSWESLKPWKKASSSSVTKTLFVLFNVSTSSYNQQLRRTISRPSRHFEAAKAPMLRRVAVDDAKDADVNEQFQTHLWLRDRPVR